MDVAERAGWALQAAFSREDVGHTDWHHAASVLAAAGALPLAVGLEARALTQAMELAVSRFARIPRRPALAPVAGESEADLGELLHFTTAQLRHGGQATTFVALALRAADLAGRPLHALERTRLTRVVRSVLVVQELDRYLGAPREPDLSLPEDPAQALELLEVEAVLQLEGIQPDQIHHGARTAFVGELIHGVIHANAVRTVLELQPEVVRPAVLRLAEQIQAQRTLVRTRAPQQFDDDALSLPASLDFLEVLGQGFDDPEKLQFACAARAIHARHDRPPEWEPLIARTLAALE